MADLTITNTALLKSSAGQTQSGTCGEAIACGDVIYIKAADSKYYKAQSDGTAEEATVAGIALNTTHAANQPVTFANFDAAFGIGATVAAGTFYYLSATAGKICPFADLVATNRVSQIGSGATTSTIRLQPINTGVAIA